MQIVTCKNYDDMSQKAAELVADALRQRPEGLFSFPAGETPVGMVDAFVGMVNAGQIDPARARYVSLDEWVGLGADNPGSCAAFNNARLLGPMQTPFADAHLINGAAADPEAERQALLAYLKQHGPLALSALGIGLNGHLGFNEDGVSFDEDAILIPLSSTTRRIMKKYLGEDVRPEYGLSIGIRQLMAAERVILMASGAAKADIVAKAVNGPVTNAVPASVLQGHPACTLVLDEAAAAKL